MRQRRTARFVMRMPFQKKARVKLCVFKLTLTLASVRKRRFELPRLLPRYHLKVVRLPISPPPQGVQTYYNLVNLNIPATSFDDGEEVAVSELRCSPCSAPEAYSTVWNENPAHKCAQYARGVLR